MYIYIYIYMYIYIYIYMWVNPLQIECKNILEVLTVVPLLPTLVF